MRNLVAVFAWAIFGLVAASGGAQATLATPALHFYNASDGSVAIGRFVSNVFQQAPSPGAFSPGWSHIAHMPESSGQMFVYNAATGAGASVDVAGSQYHTSQSFPVGYFSQGWTIVAPLRGGQIAFYRHSDGVGALALLAGDGKMSTVKGYTVPNFGQGGFKNAMGHYVKRWSSIVGTLRGTFFYDRNSGKGQVGAFSNAGVFQVTKDFGAKFSPGWTHVAAMPIPGNSLDQTLVFYNASTGQTALAILSDATRDITTSKVYDLDRGYTTVVATASQILFYNKTNGNALLADTTQAGEIPTVRKLTGQFSPGWTSIVYGF